MVCGGGGLSVLCRGCRTFGGLGLQGKPDGSLVRNIFKVSFTEEIIVAVKAVFEGMFSFSASE